MFEWVFHWITKIQFYILPKRKRGRKQARERDSEKFTSGGCIITSWPSSPPSEHSGLRNVKRAAKAAILAASTRFLFQRIRKRKNRKDEWFPKKSTQEADKLLLGYKWWVFIAYPPLSKMWRSIRMDQTNFPETTHSDSVSIALLSLQYDLKVNCYTYYQAQ